MKALTWDAATRLFKEVITGRIFTSSTEPVDIADGDLWIDDSSTPVLKARVAGVIYEVVGAGGGGGPCGPAMLADDIVNAAEIINVVDVNETESVSYELVAVDDAPLITFDSLKQAIIGLSPAGYWQLNDAASPPQDSSGNARHASATTAVTYRTTGGGGPGNYVTIPATGKIPVADNNAWSLGTTPGLTCFALVRPTTISTDRAIVCRGGSGTNYEWAIVEGASGEIRAISMTAAGALVRQSITAAGELMVNQWHAICVTISDATTGATINIYKNSNTPLGVTVTTGAGSSPNGTAVLQIGAETGYDTRAMLGSIAHFAIFPGVMSGTNIGTLMAAADADGWF